METAITVVLLQRLHGPDDCLEIRRMNVLLTGLLSIDSEGHN